jgi:hypothetical protein
MNWTLWFLWVKASLMFSLWLATTIPQFLWLGTLTLGGLALCAEAVQATTPRDTRDG